MKSIIDTLQQEVKFARTTRDKAMNVSAISKLVLLGSVIVYCVAIVKAIQQENFWLAVIIASACLLTGLLMQVVTQLLYIRAELEDKNQT